MLPAMVVAFSCAGLDRTAEGLGTVDLLPARRSKARVHFEFQRMRAALPPEEWSLFGELLELAQRGIGVHHSRKPKHYLELLPRLVRLGKVRLVLATSTLSAGIDLPVRTVVFGGGLRMPGGKGFRTIEPNLFHQICGRAGRPGQETEGNVVVARWAELGVDLESLVCGGAVPIRSQYRLTPAMVLHILIHADLSVESLLRGSFANGDLSHVRQLLRELRQERQALGADAAAVEALALLRTARECAGQVPDHVGLALQLRPGDAVLVDPEDPSVAVRAYTVQALGSGGDPEWVTAASGEALRRSWIFRLEGAPSKTKRGKRRALGLAQGEALRAMHGALDRLRELEAPAAPGEPERRAAQLDRWAAALRRLLAPEHLALWSEYDKLLQVLRRHRFVDEEDLPQLKGRMAAELVAPDDGLCVVECWIEGLLPRSDPLRFGPLLSCFLAQPKHDQQCPAEWEPALEALQRRRRQLWGCGDLRLGCWMIEPLRRWMAGQPVSTIHHETGVPVGHFCKEVLRMLELLRQLAAAGEVAGDPALGALCEQCTERLRRGLPFVPSLHLR